MKSKSKITLKKKYVLLIAFCLLFLGFGIIFLTYFPVLKEEIKYAFLPKNQKIEVSLSQNKDNTTTNILTPVDTEFGIIIPKIRANAKVIPEVDPYNSQVYQWELTRGVAHAKGTSLPDEKGNVFIFAHSAGNFYEASRFNAVFYLLTKMETGDDIYLFYKNKKYQYLVTDKRLIDPNSVSYLTGSPNKNTLTLMTCWPPGTSLKRLIVIGELKK